MISQAGYGASITEPCRPDIRLLFIRRTVQLLPKRLCPQRAQFPRATLDIDILIEPESLEKTKKIAERLGFNFDAGLMRLSGDAIQIFG